MAVRKWYRPPYAEAFPLTEAYEWALAAAAEIDQKIEGGNGCKEEDAALLVQAVYRVGNADHLELGTLFGGTAILVAMAKRHFGFGGDVYCVDNFSYKPDGFEPSPELVMENAARFDLEHALKIFVGDTHPLPPDITDRRFGSAYIDAAHDFYHTSMDWRSVKDLVDYTVIFHDYDMNHAGVVSTVRNVMQNPGWWLIHLSNHTAIMERL